MGILERIEEKLDNLLALLAPTAGNVSAAAPAPPAAGTPPTAGTPPAAPAAGTPPPVELDADGVPWDARIHSGTSSKTVKGMWKARKNVDKAEKAKITAELKAAATPPSAATPPPAAGTPPATPPPAAAGANAATEALKQQAIAECNRLTNDFKVEYDGVLELINTFDGAKTFDEVKPEHYQAVGVAMKAWADWLSFCNLEIKGIEAVLGEGTNEQVAAICGNWGVTNIAAVHYAECNDLHGKLKIYREEIEAWKASQG